MPTSTFDSAISDIKSTTPGEERGMYGPIRDLLADVLGYPRAQVRIERSAEAGVPDLTVLAESGLAGVGGAPDLIPWIVVEAKDERGVFQNPTTRERILTQKVKYVSPDTAWFLMVDPQTIVARPVQTPHPATASDIILPLDDSLMEQKFRDTFALLAHTHAGVSPLLAHFREGDERLIATQTLAFNAGMSKRHENQVFLARRHFYETLHRATIVLQSACINALQTIRPEIAHLRQAVSEFGCRYNVPAGTLIVTFDPINVSGHPRGPEESRLYDRDAANLRRQLTRRSALTRLAFRDLDAFQSRTGANDADLWDLFAIETANLILARVLLIRFFEDHGFFGHKKYVCNGGVAAFQQMMTYFGTGYTELLERAYREAGNFYAAAFDPTELDWVFQERTSALNSAIEWTMFQLSRFDFTSVKGDILTGIYDHFLEPGQRKRFGEYYTPPTIARYIVQAVKVNPGDRILDPACGSGTFLIEAYQALVGEAADRGLKTYQDAERVLAGLAGNDLNTFSAVLTQIQLLWHLLQFRSAIFASGFPDLAITEKYNSVALRDLESHGTRFAEIDQQSYDAVIGNPPYVRSERMTAQFNPRTVEYYDREISPGANLYSLFVYRALDTWCRPVDESGIAGRLGFIIPLSFCDSNQTARLRRLFAPGGRWRIREIIDMESIWRHVFDADVLPMILIAENRPSTAADQVTIRIADTTCLDFQGEDGRPRFRLDALPPQSLPYAQIFTPDGRIMSRLTPKRQPLVSKLAENPTFQDIAKPYWVRMSGARIVDARDSDPGQVPGQTWKPRLMIAGGIAFRGRGQEGQNRKGHDVYKAENIIALNIQGAPEATNIDLATVDDPSLWRFPAILPARGFAFARIYLCPTATAFDPATQAFTNTATLFFPRDELKDFPFDLLVLSRVYRFYYAIALRMGILNKERSDLYPTNLRLLPWNNALVGHANAIDALRDPLIDASMRVFAADTATKQETSRLPLTTFQKACLSKDGVAIVWSDSLLTSNYDFEVVAHPGVLRDDVTRIQLSDSLLDWLDINDQDIAHRLSLSLKANEGSTLTQSNLLNLPLPATPEATQQLQTILAASPTADRQRTLEAVIDQLDSIVGPCLGLNPEEIAFIQQEFRQDPFLSKIYPRYPFTETRKHGFRTGLDSSARYR